MYKVGDKVVYPHHGAGVVAKKEARTILGQEREYLTIKILHNDMTVNVPSENCERVGLRKVIDEDMVGAVLDVLHGDGTNDAEELESPLQVQPRQDEDRRHLRARRGRPEPLAARPGEGPLDRREADVREGQEDPRVRADVRQGHGRGRRRRPGSTMCSACRFASPRQR